MSLQKYALVFFLNSRETAVVPESKIRGKNKEKEKTQVIYGGEEYEALIVRKSCDKKFLSDIEVDTKGRIINDKSMAKETEVKVLKEKHRIQKKREEESKKRLNEDTLKQKSIFDSNDDSHDEEVFKEKITRIKSVKEKNSQDANSSYQEKSSDVEVEHDSDGSVRSVSSDRSCKNQKEPDRDLNSEKNDDEDSLILKKITKKNILYEAAMEKAAYDLSRIANDLTNVLAKKHNEINVKNLPAYIKRKGATEVRPGSKIYADDAALDEAYRFIKRPSEMIRKLMKNLVGEENLIKMVPRGNIHRAGIPENIRNAVYWYVNKHAENRIDMAYFMGVLGKQVSTLRHPKVYDGKSEKNSKNGKFTKNGKDEKFKSRQRSRSVPPTQRPSEKPEASSATEKIPPEKTAPPSSRIRSDEIPDKSDSHEATEKDELINKTESKRTENSGKINNTSSASESSAKRNRSRSSSIETDSLIPAKKGLSEISKNESPKYRSATTNDSRDSLSNDKKKSLSQHSSKHVRSSTSVYPSKRTSSSRNDRSKRSYTPRKSRSPQKNHSSERDRSLSKSPLSKKICSPRKTQLPKSSGGENNHKHRITDSPKKNSEEHSSLRNSREKSRESQRSVSSRNRKQKRWSQYVTN